MATKKKKKGVWTEFDCPECDANNPQEDGFSVGDELFCSWCGAVLNVRRTDDEDKFKLVLN